MSLDQQMKEQIFKICICILLQLFKISKMTMTSIQTCSRSIRAFILATGCKQKAKCAFFFKRFWLAALVESQHISNTVLFFNCWQAVLTRKSFRLFCRINYFLSDSTSNISPLFICWGFSRYYWPGRSNTEASSFSIPAASHATTRGRPWQTDRVILLLCCDDVLTPARWLV